MSTLGSLVLELVANTARLNSDMGKAVNIVERASRQMTRVIGALGVAGGGGGFLALAKQAFDAADAISDAAKRADVSVVSFSRLAYAANQSDVSLQALEGAAIKLQRTIGDAAGGTKSAVDALDQLGLRAEDLINLKFEDQLALIADRMVSLGSAERQAAIGADIFGRGIGEILPLLREGSEGIKELARESDSLGKTMSESTAAGIDVTDKAIKRLNASIQGGLSRIIGDIALLLSPPSEPLEQAIVKVDGLRRLIVELESMPIGLLSKGFRLEAIKNANAELAVAEKQLKKLQDAANNLKLSRSLTADTAAIRDNTRKLIEDSEDILSDATKRVTKLSTEAFERAYEETQRFFQDAYLDLVELGKRGAQSVSEEADRISEEGIDRFSEEMEKKMESATDEMSTFADQAARNMQDAFADFLFDPFENGLKGMLKGFIDTIRRMIAEAAAAKIFEILFGKKDGGGAGNVLGSILGTIFGKTPTGKAMGGPVSAGVPYLVGERGPELFLPNAGGNIVPNNKLGGSVVINNHIDARGATQELASQLPAILQENNRRMFDELDRRYGLA